MGLIGLALLTCGIPSAVATGDEVEPNSPRDLRVLPNRDGTMTIVWSAPANADLAPVDHYTVERLAPQGWTFLGPTSETTFLDASPDITASVVVGYRVTAVNAAGSNEAITVQAINRGSFQPDEDCWFLIVESQPVSAGFNGTCAVLIATAPLPEPVRTQTRSVLLVAWASARKLLDEEGMVRIH